MTFNNYFVSDSLCCPSRSSIFTGDFPHDTGVFTNAGPDRRLQGVLHPRRREPLVQHRPAARRVPHGDDGQVPQRLSAGPDALPRARYLIPSGWSQWDVAGWGYSEYDYELNENGTLHHYGHSPADYLTDVLARHGRPLHQPRRIEQAVLPRTRARSRRTPVHAGAAQRACSSPGLKAPRPPTSTSCRRNPAAWLTGHPPLTASKIGGSTGCSASACRPCRPSTTCSAGSGPRCERIG